MPNLIGLPTKPQHTGVSDRIVVGYLAIALLALLPGLAGWLYGPLPAGNLVGDWQNQFVEALQDIQFGSGLRFWLGVTGASMMALLLAYPLRKAFGQRFKLGAIGSWFHIHLLFGIAGPVLILYHCNFGRGGFNANVALAMTLLVAASGIVGQFVYMRASASFYGDKRQARADLDAVIKKLRALDTNAPAMLALIDRLEAFEEQLLAPRRGFLSRVFARLTLELRRRRFYKDAGIILAGVQRERGWNNAQHNQARRTIADQLTTFFATARRAAGRSITEQLWARWRLFHLPIFLIMVVAATLHIVAVWGMDGSNAPALDAMAELSDGSEMTDESQSTEVAAAVDAMAADQPEQASPTLPEVAKPVVVPPAPELAERPANKVSAKKSTLAEKPPPKPVVMQLAAAAPPTVSDTTAVEVMNARLDTSAVGFALQGKTLADQLAELQAARFNHSKTGFPLTGAHRKTPCASCHTQQLKGTSKQCKTCHKKDDVHHGRRPSCGRCHSTSRW